MLSPTYGKLRVVDMVEQNLNDPSTFHPQSLEKIRTLLSEPTPLNSFAPIRSLHRIIISYPSIEAAINTRQILDGSPLSNNDRVKIYFGEHTPVFGQDEDVDRHLKAPSLGKLLFISPPPSPPCGWEIKEEDPPNKATHAEDLQRALAGLNGPPGNNAANGMDVEEELDSEGLKSRTRSGSTTMVYHPKNHGDSAALPAVMVEDTTDADKVENPADEGPFEEGGRIMTHTARPPVELMEQ